MEVGIRGFGVAAVHCLTCDDAVAGGGKALSKWIHHGENETRRFILRPERATQQICVFKVLSIVETNPCDLTVSCAPQLVTVISFKVTYRADEGDMTAG